MRIRLLAVIVVLSLGCALPAADQQLLSLVMPDAKALAGANVTQIKGSPFGQFLLSRIPTSLPEYQKFVTESGFDPTRDIIEVLAATADPVQHKGLIMVRGVFDVQRIAKLVEMTGGAQPIQHNGATIIAGPDKKAVIAFLDNSIAVFGDPDNVGAALDRRSNPGALDAALMAKVTQLSGSQDIWGVSNIIPMPPKTGNVQAPGMPGMNLTALSKIQQSTFGVKFGAMVQLTAEATTETPQDSSALADLVRLVTSLAQMNQGPEAAQFASILKGLAVSATGNTLTLTLSIPEDQLEHLSPAQKQQRVRKVVQRR